MKSWFNAFQLFRKFSRRKGPTFFVAMMLTTIINLSRPHTGLAEVGPKHEVLILNSYHKGFKWTDSQTSAAIQVLREELSNLEIYVEYMDTKRIYNKAYLDHLSHIFDLKYKNISFDAIITTDDNALHFVNDYHELLFNSAPVLFCGINHYDHFQFKKQNLFTGLVEVLDIRPTIELAREIYPDLRSIFVVVDDTPTGRGQLKDIQISTASYTDLDIKYLKGTDYSHEELIAKLKLIPENSVVLLAVWLQDKFKNYVSAELSGEMISNASPVPVFGIIDMFLDQGIVGGKLLNSSYHGRIAGELAIRILKGEKPVDLPVIFESTNPYMFDNMQLKRWKIDSSQLPSGSLFINQPYLLYEQNKRLIWSMGFVFATLVLFVILLSVNTVKRRQSEKALGEREKEYEALFNNMLNGLALHEIVVDQNNQPIDYIYRDINPSFEKLTGLERKSTLGKNVSEIIPDIRKGKLDWIKVYGEVALEDKSIVMEEYSPQLDRWYNISAYSPKKGFFATVIDEITDRKKAEMEREILIENLESKNAELERFTYTVSHDLKSPLITIKGFLGMLESDAAEGNLKRMNSDIERIAKAADKMQILLDELLELSRIGRIKNPHSSMEFKELAQKAVDTVEGRLREKSIHVDIKPDPILIKGDIPRLVEVMENLVDNAAKFSVDGKQARIVIGTRQEADETVYFVEDNGVGIKPKYHDKVFGLFDKLNQNAEGTGIGLAIVKRVIEVHRGRIWVESKGDGKGTTFCFTMSAKQE
jgi:PAS domain S-box-containing protein